MSQQGTEQYSNLPQTTQPIDGRTGFAPRVTDCNILGIVLTHGNLKDKMDSILF